MALMEGLFTRTEVKEKVLSVSRKMAFTPERLHQLGLAGVKGMNPRAKHPNMEPSGPESSKVYVLSLHPGEEEDKQNRPLIGNSGRFLFRHLPVKTGFRLGYIVRTLPPNGKDGKPRKVTPTEVECFRPSVVADIERVKPRVIVGLGTDVAKWVLGDGFKVDVGVARGRRFPVKVGSHVCWFHPVYHPSYVLQKLEEEEAARRAGRPVKRNLDEPNPKDLEDAFHRDLVRAFRDGNEGEDTPEILDADLDTLLKPVTLMEGGGEKEVRYVEAFLAKASKSKRVQSVDLESSALRPYTKGAKLLSVSVGHWEGETLAIALHHPQAHWSKPHLDRIHKALKSFFCSKARKVAHNLSTELEWFAYVYGPDVLKTAKTWHCTYNQAYALDERKGGHSLNFLSVLRFGLQVKSLSKATLITGKGSGPLADFFDVGTEEKIDRARLEQTKLAYVLKYNGLDVRFTSYLETIQRRLLRADNLWGFYKDFQVKRIKALVQAQLSGMVVNETATAEFTTDLSAKVKRAERAIRELPAVKKYVARFGEFNPGSEKLIKKLYADVLNVKLTSTKEATLLDVKAKYRGDAAELAQLILDFRKPGKMLSTYVDPLKADTPNSVLFPDKKIHAVFKACWTGTGRLAAEDPSVQNWPKRKNAWLRAVIGCPANHVMLSCDEGQLEYRVAGMNSRDKVLVDSMFTGFDVHQYWAERIVRKYDKTFLARGGDMKAFRGDVKNQWVFPQIFGSSPGSCAKNLQMPEKIAYELAEEFWEQLKGVRAWQKRVTGFYDKHFYVECLSGRRRRGPLSYNMQINSPIQGLASDMVVDAMVRLAELSITLDKPYLAPVLNIHDDLTFYVPKRRVEEALEYIVPAMLTFDYPWAEGIPMMVEASVGNDWGNQSPVGKFDGVKLGIGNFTARAA
jgi:uracil-DNA glycosylase family 4